MIHTTASTRSPGRSPGVLGWLALIIAVLAGIVALMAGPGYRLGWWGLGQGLELIRWSATAALIDALLAFVAIAMAWRAASARQAMVGIVAGVLALAVVAPPLYYWRQATSLPHIHDISTDTANPPLFVAILPLRQRAPNSTHYTSADAAQQRAAYPDIAPVRLQMAPARALELCERVARSMGWTMIDIAPADGRIEATATTLLFGFRDDVVIRITSEGDTSRVDMRSESRIGGFDFGTNARRVRAYMGRLEAAAAK